MSVGTKRKGPENRAFMCLGAEEGIRTPTVLLPPAPQAGASASSATSASLRKPFPSIWQKRDVDNKPPRSHTVDLKIDRGQSCGLLKPPAPSHELSTRMRVKSSPRRYCSDDVLQWRALQKLVQKACS
jgi:hypothetical protein